jgi:ribulose-phosphate 3-epimerase
VRGAEIEPSLYAADFLRLGEQIAALLDAGARVFHFDVGDGHFVPPVTIGPVVLRSIAPLVHARGGVLDCHLMVDDPVHHFREIAESGGDSVTFHVEAVGDSASVVEAARGLGLGVGVACNPATPVDQLADAAREADLALCMSIEPGYSGQAFMPEALPRIARLRELLPPGVHVQVDGGIDRETARPAREAGANLLVAGTAVFGADDIDAAFRELAAAAA